MGANSEREVDFSPNLPDQYQRRFEALTDELIEFQEDLDREVAIKDEIRYVENEIEDEVTEGQIRYLAALEVLLDLIEINYDIRKNSELHVVRPDLIATKTTQRSSRNRNALSFRKNGGRSSERKVSASSSGKWSERHPRKYEWRAECS